MQQNSICALFWWNSLGRYVEWIAGVRWAATHTLSACNHRRLQHRVMWYVCRFMLDVLLPIVIIISAMHLLHYLENLCHFRWNNFLQIRKMCVREKTKMVYCFASGMEMRAVNDATKKREDDTRTLSIYMLFDIFHLATRASIILSEFYKPILPLILRGNNVEFVILPWIT